MSQKAPWFYLFAGPRTDTKTATALVGPFNTEVIAWRYFSPLVGLLLGRHDGVTGMVDDAIHALIIGDGQSRSADMWVGASTHYREGVANHLFPAHAFGDCIPEKRHYPLHLRPDTEQNDLVHWELTEASGEAILSGSFTITEQDFVHHRPTGAPSFDELWPLEQYAMLARLDEEIVRLDPAIQSNQIKPRTIAPREVTLDTDGLAG